MAQFRKKPVAIEAVQFTGSNCIEIIRFMGGPWENPELHETDIPMIHTLEGDMLASSGDWIIKGVAGEFYPCKPDIFAATYEPDVGHVWWGAGDPDCPADIKAGNGEIHTLRCKKCGQTSPRDKACHLPVKGWLDGDARRNGAG